MRAIVDFTLGRVAALLLIWFLSVASAIAQDSKSKPNRAPANRKTTPADSELSRSRSDVLQKIKETRGGAEKLLALHEAERQRAEERYEQRKDLYYKGLISRNEVLEAESALLQAMARIDEDKRWLAETDMAITEAVSYTHLTLPTICSV